MKSRQWFGALLVLAGVGGLAYVGQKAAPAGVSMAEAAQAFLSTLDAEQKARSTFAFDDSERTRWHFIPLQDANQQSTRKGLPLEAMNAKQKKAALALLASGTSMSGYKQATTIMSLEAILRDLEKGGRMVRSPEWYFISIFGTPSPTGKWGWRFEGHHLSLNFTIEGGNVASATPAFFGANPAIVKAGPKKGLRTLADAEVLAIELFESLDAEQKKVAFRSEPFPEVKGHNAAPEVGAPVGLAAGEMNGKQLAILKKLLQSYASRMPGNIGEVQLQQVRDAGVENIHFAFSGGARNGEARTYRVQGPTFVVEFLNTQPDSARNPANHVHSCWRSISGDFGLPAR